MQWYVEYQQVMSVIVVDISTALISNKTFNFCVPQGSCVGLVVEQTTAGKKTITSEININGKIMHRSGSIQYLGVDLNGKLTLKGIMKRKCRTTTGHLQKLKPIRKIQAVRASTIIARGLLTRTLTVPILWMQDYLNPIWKSYKGSKHDHQNRYWRK